MWCQHASDSGGMTWFNYHFLSLWAWASNRNPRALPLACFRHSKSLFFKASLISVFVESLYHNSKRNTGFRPRDLSTIRAPTWSDHYHTGWMSTVYGQTARKDLNAPVISSPVSSCSPTKPITCWMSRDVGMAVRAIRQPALTSLAVAVQEKCC
eukprot:SAG31_NODE_600_length_13647_cov_3.894376_12_plen_154_part_00